MIEQLDRRRRAVAERWDLDRDIVLIGAGEPVSIPGRADLTYPFRSHSEYFYLTDRERPGGVLAFDPSEGWTDFVVPVSRDEQVWEGRRPTDVEGVDIWQLDGWLARHGRGRPVGVLGCPVAGIAFDEALTGRLRGGLNHVRREKDEVELDRMRRAESATRAGFELIVPMLAAGVSERAVQIELEAEFMRAGADGTAYETIVAGGSNSAALHFPPTAHPLRDGELVLIDAGAEYRGYASDVTRTYPVSGRFTPEQAQLHELVRLAGVAAIELCLSGTEFRKVHEAAALVVGRGLAEFGLLRGSPESLFESGAVSLFFPHGVGHMVGLGVRDAGERLPGRSPDADRYPRLRVDLPLLPGHVVTVEPGVYFVPALIGDDELRRRHRDAVDWDRADGLLGFGGIRIEHNVLVTSDGCEVLTADIPV